MRYTASKAWATDHYVCWSITDLLRKEQIINQLNRVRAQREDVSRHQWTMWALRWEWGCLVSDSLQLFFTLSPLKIPEEPKGKYLTAVLSAAKSFQLYFSLLTLRLNSDELLNPTFPWANLCPPLNFTLVSFFFFVVFNVRSTLKISRGAPKANEQRIRRKHKETGGWTYHMCQWECQCHDLRGVGKKKKRSVSRALILLSICSRSGDTRSTEG